MPQDVPVYRASRGGNKAKDVSMYSKWPQITNESAMDL
jgi:hypothetical protein